MVFKSAWFLIASVLLAYYIYNPLPDDLEERYKVMLADAVFRTLGHTASLAEWLGMKHYMDVMMLLTDFEHTEPKSDEHLEVTDTSFVNIPVRLFVPKQNSKTLRRGVIYIHGGGWCLGSASMEAYDRLSKKMAQQLNAVVVSMNYRLAPKFNFPTQFDDVYAVAKFFLEKSTLEKYSIDPNRVAVSGDSAGGNLAAAVAQQLQYDPEVTVKLKIQALIYPVLQSLDLNTTSYQDNAHMPILSRYIMVRFWSEYFTSDPKLFDAMYANRHIPSEYAHLFQFVNWNMLLPENLKKNHVYQIVQHKDSSFVKKYPGILDPRASPLLMEDEKLKGLPLTYVITCMYDVLRDDGFMYVSRLRKAGVHVVHENYNCFHGILILNSWPFEFDIANRIETKYVNWLEANL
ncbi:arylacetamide deacetylase [Gastrophryne carolinensis]